jgi:hypothetical protein
MKNIWSDLARQRESTVLAMLTLQWQRSKDIRAAVRSMPGFDQLTRPTTLQRATTRAIARLAARGQVETRVRLRRGRIVATVRLSPNSPTSLLGESAPSTGAQAPALVSASGGGGTV